MSFLGKLASQMESQFSLGENQNHTLDSVVDGEYVKYGALGDLANKFDQSAERRYMEEGYLRRDPYNVDPKLFEVLMQEPTATIFIKKRFFSSIAENFRPDFMDKEEKLYYKAIKVLFQNKCRQIAALEKLSKIQRATSAVGKIDDQIMPLIISLSDAFNTGSGLFGTTSAFDAEASQFAKTVDKIRRVYSFNETNPYTTWITDDSNLFKTQFGQGTGVIEITNFINFTTNVSTDLKSPGNFTVSIADPYESMVITEWDIEKAITDASNLFKNHKIFQFGQDSADSIIEEKTNILNQLRRARNASPITFKINPDTFLGKRVRAIFDRTGTELVFDYDSTGGTGFPGLGGFGNSVNIADEYLINGAVAGYDGLDNRKQKVPVLDFVFRKESEVSVFKALIAAIFNKMQLEANSQNAVYNHNQSTNYARRKLRANFGGKLIIQPQDTIHIYINSRSRFDNRLLGGLKQMFEGQGILQSITKNIADTSNAISSLLNPKGNANLQVEKSIYVGADFPDFVWQMIRNQFVGEKEGTHVFAGIVDGASDNWSDGKFTVDVRGSDNSAYFEMGKINFKPGVDTFNGAIFDPLTPFKSNFDTISYNSSEDVPELLDENKAILGSSQDKDTPLVKFKLGPNAGKKATGDNYVQDRSLDPHTGLITKVFYAPDGLAYKWKEGIGVFVQFGNSLDLNDPNKVGNPSLTKEPFAGQDVMNVLSLLVTGTPYNYANYWKTVTSMDGTASDPQTGQDSAYSYYTSLKNDLIKNNVLWGNFLPFKNVVMNEQAYAQALQRQFDITRRNKDLEIKLEKLKELNNAASLLGATNILSENESSKFSPRFQEVQHQAEELQKQINKDLEELKQQDTDYFVMTGDEVQFDFSTFLEKDKLQSTSSAATADNANLRRMLRRQINQLTRRMSYNVRANEDKNLFIVDDFYDKDYDIAAYEQSLTDGLKLYNNEYASVKDKITYTAELLNLEVFCDTQGHIRVRPPQYNRMPSSVFYRMMALKKKQGIQVFPQFLDDIFSSQLKTLRERIEVIEDLIRLDCAVLGFNDDGTAKDFILSNANSNSADAFAFVSNTEGLISDIPQLLIAANPDQVDAGNADLEAVKEFVFIKEQATSTKDLFTSAQRYQSIIDAFKAQNGSISGVPVGSLASFDANTYIDKLITRIQTKSGQRVSRDNFLQTNSLNQKDVVIPAGTTIDVFKVTRELSSKLVERQKALKLFYNAIKNSNEFKTLDNNPDLASQLTTSGTYNNSNIPEVFEHMIEDETYDDYGVGSGSRYIIKNSQIKSLSIAENPPPFTMVEVQGQFNQFANNSSSLPSELNSFSGNGNALVTAVAIDYDMWRNYGFRQQSPVTVPFLSDPNTQCAPYASMILSRNRKSILKGTVTIAGNEYMQPGEVVFIEQRGLLFYVTAVRHNFSFGSFTTTLDLAYGHTPGEYIPTYLDMIGKLIVKNKDVGAMVIQRQSNSSNETNMGIVQRDKNSAMVINKDEKNEFKNSFSAFNSQTINNILYQAAYIINANQSKGNGIIANLELRIYYDDYNEPNSDLLRFADTVLDIFRKGSVSVNEDPKITSVAPLPKDNVQLVKINLSDPEETRSPSQKAIDSARNQIATVSTSDGSPSSVTLTSDGGTGTNSPDSGEGNNNGKKVSAKKERDKLRTALFSYIID
jgi:hypothetical protein